MNTMNRRYSNDRERNYQNDWNRQKSGNREYAPEQERDTRDRYYGDTRFLNDERFRQDRYERGDASFEEERMHRNYGRYGADYDTSDRDMRYRDNLNTQHQGQHGWNSEERFRDTYGRDQNQGNRNQFSRDFDSSPVSWTYSEVWMIPGPMTGKGPQGYQRSDEDIVEDACERLTQHGKVDAEDIRVDCEEGELILEGTVASRHEKRLAEEAVENISGISDVQNRLRIEKQHKDTSKSSQNTSESAMKKNGKSSMGESNASSRNNKMHATTS